MVIWFLFFISQNYDQPIDPEPSSKIDVVTHQPEDNVNLFTAMLYIIKGYQKLLADQQGDVCNFTPSCSEYAYRVIKKYKIKGILMIFDRFERCNPGAWRYQNIYYKTQETKKRGMKLFDPPEDFPCH